MIKWQRFEKFMVAFAKVMLFLFVAFVGVAIMHCDYSRATWRGVYRILGSLMFLVGMIGTCLTLNRRLPGNKSN